MYNVEFRPSFSVNARHTNFSKCKISYSTVLAKAMASIFYNGRCERLFGKTMLFKHDAYIKTNTHNNPQDKKATQQVFYLNYAIDKHNLKQDNEPLLHRISTKKCHKTLNVYLLPTGTWCKNAQAIFLILWSAFTSPKGKFKL